MNINGSKSRFEDDALDNMVFVVPFFFCFLFFFSFFLGKEGGFKNLIAILFINFIHEDIN